MDATRTTQEWNRMNEHTIGSLAFGVKQQIQRNHLPSKKESTMLTYVSMNVTRKIYGNIKLVPRYYLRIGEEKLNSSRLRELDNSNPKYYSRPFPLRIPPLR